MRPPNRRHSEPRNTHMASFSFERPVLVTWLSPWVASGASAGSPAAASTWGSIRSGRSVNERSLLGGSGLAAGVVGRGVVALVVVMAGVRIGGGLHDPAVDARDDAHGTERGVPEVVDQAPGHPWEAEGQHDRPVRRRGQVDVLGIALLDDVLGGGDAHQATALVLAVLAVPEVVERVDG